MLDRATGDLYRIEWHKSRISNLYQFYTCVCVCVSSVCGNVDSIWHQMPQHHFNLVEIYKGFG